MNQLMYVGGAPWDNLATPNDGEMAMLNADSIVKNYNLDYKIRTYPVSDNNGVLPKYHSVYKYDDNEETFIGLANYNYPNAVQNNIAFKFMENSLKNGDTELVSAVDLNPRYTVGVFENKQAFKIFDDDIKHYYVIINDHLKLDGKVMLLNTPVRVACTNAFNAAINKSLYCTRIPATDDERYNAELVSKLEDTAKNAIAGLEHKSKKLLEVKIDKKKYDKILDSIFPMPKVDNISEDEEMMPSGTIMKHIELAEIQRATFNECMAKDDLQNYKGTGYQVFNAITDYTQHYFKKGEKAFDAKYKLTLLPKFGDVMNTEGALVNKVLKMLWAA